MKFRFTLNLLFLIIFGLFLQQKTYSQCPQIESILVDACDTGTDEGFNEMVRFKVGTTAINTNNLSVNWPSNSWQNLVQNATTASKVATLNAQIIVAGGCGQLIEPLGGVLPANAKVILVSSFNFNVASNYFGAISDNIYIIFQNNSTASGGHFANYSTTSGVRTLTMTFGGGCSDSVSYQRTLLKNINGTYGPAFPDPTANALNDGATVNFTPSGTASYVNNGCVAPVEVFSVDAGNSPVSACAGATISLIGTAVGQQSVEWSAPSGNFSSSTTLATNYTINPTATGSITLTLKATNTCSVDKTDTIIVNVNSGITPTFTAVSTICSGTSLAALPTTSNNSITGTWSPALDNTATKTYTFTPTAGQCASTTTLIITVNPLITPTFTAVSPICSGGSLAALPTTSNNGIMGTWSPALDNTATKTYTFTPTAGQCASITTLTITVNTGGTLILFCDTANTTATSVAFDWNNITGYLGYNYSYSIAGAPAVVGFQVSPSHFDVPVYGPGISVTFEILSVVGVSCVPSVSATCNSSCSSTINPTFTAVSPICSGTSLAALPTTSNNGIMGTWSPALDNVATKTYTFTPTAGQCASTTTLTITVNPSIIPTFTAVSPICSGTSLAALPTTSNNGIIGTWSPALDNTATKTYTFTPTAGQCASTTTLTITVNPLITPTFTAVLPICFGGSLVPLPTTSNNSITGTWSPALDNTATKTYTFTPTAGQCASTTTLTITVNPLIAPTFTAVSPICSGTSLAALPTTSNNGIMGTWSPALDITATKTYTFTPTLGQCASNVSLTIVVNSNVTADLIYYLCTNKAGQIVAPITIDANLSSTDYSFAWEYNGSSISATSSSYDATSVGIYTVTATSISGGCSMIFNAFVKESMQATAEVSVETDFNNHQQIVVKVTGGLGNYEYQLNDGLPQSSGVFAVSRGGEYTITVIDKLGCNNFALNVNVLNYPRFFTPNNDGNNDTWNIEGLTHPELAVVSIFDRYGKLLKQISPLGLGWDGIFNGKELPSTDYWFTLLYQEIIGERKEFKAHFSLKR